MFVVQQEEKRRAALVARANQEQDEDLGWGDDEGWDFSVSSSVDSCFD